MDILKQIVVVLLISFLSINLKAEFKVDSILNIVENSKNDSVKAGLYKQLYFHYLTKKNDSALFYANKARNIVSGTKSITEATINLANAYKYVGLYDTAIQLIFDNLKSFDEKKYPSLVALSYYSLGEFNRASNQLINAIDYIKKSLRIYIHLNKSMGIAKCYNRLAAINFELSNLVKAIEQADSSIRICKDKDISLLANNYEIIGAVYTQQNKVKKALLYLNKALIISKKIEDVDLITNTLINISNNYLKNSEYKKAVFYGLKAYNLACKTNTMIHKVTSSVMLANSYIKLNKYKEAYKFKAIADGVRLELLYKERDDRITELNKKYEVNKKMQKIENQKLLILENKSQLKYENILNYLLILGISLLLIFLIIVYFILAKLKKMNKELTEKNTKIELQSKELEKNNIKLVELDKFKNEMTNMIVHDLKNPLGLIINYTDFSDTSKALRVIKFSGYQTLNLVNNILDIQKYEDEEIKINYQSIVLLDVINKIYKQFSLLIEQKKITFINEITNDFKVEADIDIVERIIVNILSNAMKFTPIKGKISIKAIKKDKFIKVIITDNGYGIMKEDMNLLFRKYGRAKVKNPGMIPSTGLGLYFCKLAVNAQGGEIGVESEYHKGSIFWFTLLRGKNNIPNH